MKTLIYISSGLIGLFVLAIVVMVITLVDFSADKNLDNFIAAKMQALEAKGLAVAFIKDGEISWSKNYGYADLEAQKKVTDDTIFQIASVSKTVTGVAIMQLYEKDLIDLDVSINE